MLNYILKKLAVYSMIAAAIVLFMIAICLGQTGDSANTNYSLNYMKSDGLSFHNYNLPDFQVIIMALLNTTALLAFIIIISTAVAVPGGIWMAVRGRRNIASGQNAVYCLSGAVVMLLSGAMLLSGLLAISSQAWNFWENSTLQFNLLVIFFALCPVVMLVFKTHSEISQVLGQKYIVAAQAKGLSRTQVLWRHGFKNIAAPLTAAIYKQIPLYLSMALIMENIFQWPGIGKMSYQAILNYDIRLAAVILVVMTFVVLIAKLASDIISAAVDPRLRIEFDYYSEGDNF